MESVEKIAETVLYEGYLLFPYRRSALKNQQRWTFGGVYPRQYSEASGGNDPWRMQTQCLVVGDAATTLQVTVRFLHVADRLVGSVVAPWEDGAAASDRTAAGQALRYVEELRVGARVYQPWEEAIEREVLIEDPPLRLGDLIVQPRRVELDIPAGRSEEPLLDSAGAMMGALVREWSSLQGAVELTAEPLGRIDGVPPGASGYRLTVRIINTTPWPDQRSDGRERAQAVCQTLISTHTILRAWGGEFISLLEPPPEYAVASGACVNIKTWPVLAGAPGERHTLLSSPIILYDYPQIAPESPGDLFDATEIDELLTLSIMTLTDEEKQEMRESDARAREILERTESLSTDQLMKLHGAIRGLQPLRGKDS